METQSRLEKPKLSAYFGQLGWLYALAILHVFIFIVGIISMTVGLGWDQYIYPILIGLNTIVMFCYQPWQIMGALNEGLEYKRGMQALDELGISKR